MFSIKELDKINWSNFSTYDMLRILCDAPFVKVDCKDWRRLAKQWPELISHDVYVDKKAMIDELAALIR